MLKVHVTTIRNGQYIYGNASGINAIWSDLKTARGIERRAKNWAARLAKPGDTICALQLDPINVYRKPIRELFRFEA